jgi:hypothetical protein
MVSYTHGGTERSGMQMKLEILWDLLIGKLMPSRELVVPRSWNPDTWKVNVKFFYQTNISLNNDH